MRSEDVPNYPAFNIVNTESTVTMPDGKIQTAPVAMLLTKVDGEPHYTFASYGNVEDLSASEYQLLMVESLVSRLETGVDLLKRSDDAE